MRVPEAAATEHLRPEVDVKNARGLLDFPSDAVLGRTLNQCAEHNSATSTSSGTAEYNHGKKRRVQFEKRELPHPASKYWQEGIES